MRESVLLGFLVGRVGPTTLRRELLGDDRSPLPMIPSVPAPEFELLPLHLLRLCDAVLDRELDAALLGPIASRLTVLGMLRRSARDPDARVVGEVVEAWARADGPGLDRETVRVHRRWIVTRRHPSTDA